jgi:hypothetical protein
MIEMLVVYAVAILLATCIILAILAWIVGAFRPDAIIRRCMLAGWFCGALAGVVLGPIVLFLFMLYESALQGTNFLGLELLAGPVYGAIVLGVSGAAVGSIVGVLVKSSIKSYRRSVEPSPKPLARVDEH